MTPPTGSQFAPTRWTLVQRSGLQDESTRAALSELCEAYYQPVLKFILNQVHDEDLSRDLAQSFFAQLLSRAGLEKADPARGRFRSYLLGAVKHFLMDERKSISREKRGGKVEFTSLEEEQGSGEDSKANKGILSSLSSAPEAEYDRSWALTIMSRALQRLEHQYQATEKLEDFLRLKPWLAGEPPSSNLAQAALQIGMTETALKVAIHRIRKRFRDLVRDEISQTLIEGETLDGELNYLIEVLSRPN